MKDYINKTVFNQFCHDWGQYVKDNDIQVYTQEQGYMDVKIICPLKMPLKECRYLNKQLGINILNYHGNGDALMRYREDQKLCNQK